MKESPCTIATIQIILTAFTVQQTETSNHISCLPYESSKCKLHWSLEVNANTALHPTPTALELWASPAKTNTETKHLRAWSLKLLVKDIFCFKMTRKFRILNRIATRTDLFFHIKLVRCSFFNQRTNFSLKVLITGEYLAEEFVYHIFIHTITEKTIQISCSELYKPM